MSSAAKNKKNFRLNFIRPGDTVYKRNFDRRMLKLGTVAERKIQLWVYAVECMEIGDFWRRQIDRWPWLNRFWKFDVVRIQEPSRAVSEMLLNPKVEVYRVTRTWYGARRRKLLRRNFQLPKPVVLTIKEPEGAA